MDVRLGKNLMIETPHEDLELHLLEEYTKENPYLLHPGEFLPCRDAFEKIRVPERLSAQFVLKSSRAREGYQHLLAGWIDPGWVGGRLTLEIKNIRRYHAMPLYPWNAHWSARVPFHEPSAD